MIRLRKDTSKKEERWLSVATGLVAGLRASDSPVTGRETEETRRMQAAQSQHAVQKIMTGWFRDCTQAQKKFRGLQFFSKRTPQ